jgi:alpha-L-fucosidase
LSAAALPAGNFPLRWTGFITAPVSGVHTLYVSSIDDARPWVGGTKLTNRWNDGIAVDPATVTLVAGQRYAITPEVYESVKTALARSSWASPGQAKPVIPGASLSSL